MTDLLRLSGRTALVAGAGGIGAAVAGALHRAGVRVALTDVDPAALEAVATDTGLDSVLPADLTQSAAARRVVDSAAEALGGLDIFVHAVGVNDRRPALEVDDELWRRIIGVNLDSAWWCAQQAGRHMVAAGYGRVVLLSSVSGLLAHADHGPYAASKGAINQLTRVLAREWAAAGVTVNAIAPGYTDTDLTRAYLDRDGTRQRLEALVPAGRLGTVTDLVGPALFLCSAAAEFVTGHVLYADGGRTLV